MKKAILFVFGILLLISPFHVVANFDIEGTNITYTPFSIENINLFNKPPENEIAALKLNDSVIKQILLENHQYINVKLPLSNDSVLILRLRKTQNKKNDMETVIGTVSGDEEINLDFVSYQGTIKDINESWVSFSVSDIGIRTIIMVKEQIWLLSPPFSREKSNSSVYSLKKDSSVYKRPQDINDLSYQFSECLDKFIQTSSRQNSIIKSEAENIKSEDTLTVKIAVESDYETFMAFNNDAEQATFYLLSLFAAVSQIYERELKMKLDVSFTRVWSTPENPYNSNYNTSGELVAAFNNYWANNMQEVDRNIAHFHTKRIPGFNVAGLSGGGSLCNKRLTSWTNYSGTDINNYVIKLVAHEIGHNFNVLHTHNCVWPVGLGGALGPIDQCGTNCTGEIILNEGTIMSYCPQQIPLVFHPMSRILIRNVANSSTCIGDGSSESFTISGKVKVDGLGLEGVEIKVRTAMGIVAQTITDHEGKYSIKLPVNGYNIDASIDGYAIMNHEYVALVADAIGVDFTAKTVNADVYEPDNDANQANLICTDGTIQERTHHNPFDFDFIKFFAKSGDLFTIKTFPTLGWELSSFNTHWLYIRNSDEEIELEQTIIHDSIIWIVPKTDTFFVDISGFVAPYGFSISSKTTNEYTEEVTICKDEFYEGWNNSGQYQRTLNSILGCDSIVKTTLNVQELPIPDFINDADTLKSIVSHHSYKWYDQDGAIEGATSNQYIVEKSGTYYLEVTSEYGCSAMSNGMNLIKTGINDLTKNQFNLYVIPNPNDGKFRLIFENGKSVKYQVQIINELGQVQFGKQVYLISNFYEEEFEMSNLPKGNYFVKVFDGLSTTTKKIILK